MSRRVSLFDGQRRVMGGSVNEAAQAVRVASEAGAAGPLLIFDDATGNVVDIDPTFEAQEPDIVQEPRKRGRPKLGVVAREVTLLPRHWEWLNAQPGGGSVALRKLVDEARRTSAGRDRVRGAQEAAYRFIHAVAGDLPGFEETSRALFSSDREQFAASMADWPRDIRDYAVALIAVDANDGASTAADTNTEDGAGAD